MLVLRDPDEGCTVLVDNQENRRRYARMIAEQKQHEAAELHCIAANQAAERLNPEGACNHSTSTFAPNPRQLHCYLRTQSGAKTHTRTATH